MCWRSCRTGCGASCPTGSSRKLGIHDSTLRNLVRQDRIDRGEQAGHNCERLPSTARLVPGASTRHPNPCIGLVLLRPGHR
jgi:hypothetical protein